jgi:hypothetical protein
VPNTHDIRITSTHPPHRLDRRGSLLEGRGWVCDASGSYAPRP